MSARDNYAANKKSFVDQLTEQQSELAKGATTNSQPVVKQTLQFSADAVGEVLEYLNSPIVDKALETFHTSDSERARAAVDLNKYLAEAGLKFAKNVRWELHDNNWCVDLQVAPRITVHLDNDVTLPVPLPSVSVHYDSHDGWGHGVC